MTGYLTEDEVNSVTHPFDHLISGVIWLVRNGTNYVDVAASIENPTTQQTSEVLENPNNHRANTFVDVFAARTVIGHDIEGRLKIFQLDGLHGRDRPTRGIDLRSLANILIDLGFHNAINLDGGGSSTTVQEDQMVSYPSDVCEDATPIESIRCERPVSSIVCVHDRISAVVPSVAPATLPTLPTTTPTPTPAPGKTNEHMATPSKTIETTVPTFSPSTSTMDATGTTLLTLLLSLSVSVHVALCYFIGFQRRDLRESCRNPWEVANRQCCQRAAKYIEIEIVEKQQLKSIHSQEDLSQWEGVGGEEGGEVDAENI